MGETLAQGAGCVNQVDPTGRSYYDAPMSQHPFVITISSEKGGVGKTTLATNLAIFLKAMREDLSVTVFSFDNHFTVDKMFALPGQHPHGTVAELLGGTTGCDLLHTGQYGVNYIPSSNVLSELRSSVQGPMFLARLLATSRIPGIIVIDTRPELDILTQNALYAADQVLIPVKDMASLENCRNIFTLFDSRGLDKKSLALIPCLVDSRVKFDGMFRDQRTLLKAFAINRGYRCLDTYIAKSPKVDSLNTNPDGRIFPILTHARGTDVFGQFVQLTRLMLATLRGLKESRAQQFSAWLNAEDERRNAAFASRRAAVKPHCPICGSPSLDNVNHPPGLYYETGDGSSRGFINGDCFSDLITALLLPSGSSLSPTDPLSALLLDATSAATFLIRPVQNGTATQMELMAIDPGGKAIIRQRIACNGYEGSILNRREARLAHLVNVTIGAQGLGQEGTFLIVQPVDPGAPESILQEESYRSFRKLRQRCMGHLAPTATQ